MVLVWVLMLGQWTSHKTFKLPNMRLRAYGVDRRTKACVLRDLEKAGLIEVVRRKGKSPTVTLRYL